MPEKRTIKESKEAILKKLRARLNAIVYTPVSVETITTFATTALDALIILIDDVVAEYKKHNKNTEETGKDLEHNAFAYFNLQSVAELLDAINETDEHIQDLTVRVKSEITQEGAQIMPAQPGMPPNFDSGAGAEVRERLFARLLTLIYVLEKDYELTSADRVMHEEIVLKDQMRNEPYVRVVIPSLNRVLYICDEEGNATYVFDTDVLSDIGMTIGQIDSEYEYKIQKQALIAQNQKVGTRLIMSDTWRYDISRLLQESFGGDATEPAVQTPAQRQSEFVRQKFLPWDDFVERVREQYKKDGKPDRRGRWYKKTYKKNHGWPSNPDQTVKYKNKWQSWQALVNRYHEPVIEDYEEFAKDVRKLYEQAGKPNSVYDWYTSIPDKENRGWPSAARASKKYKDSWQGWSAVVGKEVTDFLPWDEFVEEVCEQYKKEGKPDRIQDWYRKVYKKHRGWSAGPASHKNYKDKWQGWRALVNPYYEPIIEDYDEFADEVRQIWEQDGKSTGVYNWYKNIEDKQNRGWPTASQVLKEYKKDWESWPALIGKEVIEPLSWDNFVEEVREQYKKDGKPSHLQDWYRKIYKKHRGWLSATHILRKYADNWNGWDVLVGKNKKDKK